MFQAIKLSMLSLVAVLVLTVSACGGGGSGASTTSEGDSAGGTVGQEQDSSVSTRTLQRIIISPYIDTLAKDDQIDFVATGIYSDQSSADLSDQVNWSVNDESLADIDSGGHVTPLTSGVVTIISAIDGLQAEHSLTITEVTLDSIRIIPSQAEIASGLQQEYQALGHFSDGSLKDVSDQVSWSSSSLQVASIGSSVALGIAPGVAMISASYEGKTGQATLTINAAILQNLEVELPGGDLQVQLNSAIRATGYFSDGSIRDVSAQVDWQTGDEQIARVDSASLTVEGLAVGDTVLLAQLQGIQAQATVIVNDAVLTGIEISPHNASLAAGFNQQMTATGIYSNQTAKDLTDQVTWLSGDTDLASVDNRSDAAGQVTAIGKGRVSISAYFDGYSGVADLMVTDAELLGLDVTPVNAELPNGRQMQFHATAYYSDGSSKDVTGQASWQSSTQNASLPGNGASGQFKANAQGATLIVATLNGEQGFTSLLVTDASLDSLGIVAATTNQPLGIDQRLTAYAQYSDGTHLDVTEQVIWRSNDESVAQVSNSESNKAVVTPLGTGNVQITASLDGVQASRSIDITDAVLTSIQLAANTGPFYVNQQREVNATGSYSDGSEQILTGHVQWVMASDDVAVVSNAGGSEGVVTAISAGQVEISALLDGINSNQLSFEITENPNTPASIGIAATPNVILSNGTDTTTLQATVRPLLAGGEIADGTVINFVVIENGITRVVPATTLNAVASIELTSVTTGYIEVTAEVENTGLTAMTSVYATDNLAKVLQIASTSRVSLIDNDAVYEAGSIFLLYMRNLSNRDFDVVAFIAANGNYYLPDAPVTDAAFLSDGVLEGGEYTSAGYQLDNDTANNVISLGYALSDARSGTGFGFTVRY